MTVWTVPALVTRVVDGDTLIADLDLGWGIWHKGARVRLARINCPEMSAPGGINAKVYAERVLADSISHTGTVTPVTIASRKLDNYGRTLAEVFVPMPDGQRVNLSDVLLNAGHAEPMSD